VNFEGGGGCRKAINQGAYPEAIRPERAKVFFWKTEARVEVRKELRVSLKKGISCGGGNARIELCVRSMGRSFETVKALHYTDACQCERLTHEKRRTKQQARKCGRKEDSCDSEGGAPGGGGDLPKKRGWQGGGPGVLRNEHPYERKSANVGSEPHNWVFPDKSAWGCGPGQTLVR